MDDNARPDCGFVGLGMLGGPIAQRILRGGYRLLLWDIDPQRFTAFADTSAEVADGIADLGARSDHVGICVVDDAGVRAVCAELIPAMRPGSRIAIHSTINPKTCQSLAAQAAQSGISVLDAPTTGIGGAAAAGELTVMIGGARDAVAAAIPVIETFGKLVLHMGESGAGMNAKLVNNGLSAANLSLAHATLEVGEALGVDRDTLAKILQSGTARSYGGEIASRLREPSDFALGAKLLLKDVELLSDSLPENAAVKRVYDAAMPFLRRAYQEEE